VYGADGTLYLTDLLETTELDEYQILDFFKKINYNGVEVAGDRSVKAQTGLPGHDWYSVLKRTGIRIIPVDNRDIFYIQASVRRAFQEGKIKIDPKNRTLVKRMKSYNYKNDKVNKDEHSHTGDALCYLWRSLHFESGKTRIG
jgi:hypothetical protein